MSGFKIAGISVLAVVGGLLLLAQLQNMNLVERPNTSAITTFSTTDLEKGIVYNINKERAAQGLNTLTWKDDLAEVGRKHSEWMAATGNFEHSGNQYYNCMGENLLMQTRSFMTAEEAVSTWMESEGHREAILFKSHIAAGAGVAQAENGNTYYTLIMDSTLC